ncbi:MAG TPA: hypothetical protein VN752_02505 [Solirubrobacterales bacterium]|nr:hypothetical protein [Solirubrobacterales bacterium]
MPLAEDLPEGTIAVVAFVRPSLGRITKAELQRALVQAAAGAGREGLPKRGGRAYRRLEKTAFGELLDAVWIRGQAAEMAIAVSPRQVSRELARLLKQSFENRAEYHRFLREAHYSRRDVRERVELQMLGVRMQERISRGVDSRAEERDAFAKFAEAYSDRWRSRTFCAPPYATERCVNGPPPS